MKKQFGTLTSGHWRVTVQSTKEVQIFSELSECKQWIELVKHTFSDSTMKFEIAQIREWTAIV